MSDVKKLPAALWALIAVILISLVAGGCASVPDDREPGINPDNGGIFITPATPELLAGLDHYDQVDAATDEYGRPVLLTTDGTLRDLSIYALVWDETAQTVVPAAGEPLYHLAEMGPDTPVLLSFSFPGILPTVGLSFTDNSGTLRSYQLIVSGEDGSVLLADRSETGN